MFEPLLIRYPLFALFSSAELSFLISRSDCHDFNTGEVLFQEDTSGAWVHLLLEGRVRILRRLADGREASLGTARSGELVGEYVLLTPHRHTATARASSDCRVLRMPVDRIRALLSAHGIDGALLKKLIRLHASLHFLTGRQYLGFMSAASALAYVDLLSEQHFLPIRTIQAPGIAEDRWFQVLEGTVTVEYSDGRQYEVLAGQCFGSLLPRTTGSGQLRDRHLETTPITVSLSEVLCLSITTEQFLTQSACPKSEWDLPLNESRQSILTHYLPLTRFPWHPQHSEADCGLAALKMVAEALGRSVKDDLNAMAIELSPRGLSLMQLKAIAEGLGLRAEAFRIDPDHLPDVRLPAIAHLTSGHYVALFDVIGPHMIVSDPATSQQLVTRNDFRTRWSGYLLVVS